MFRRAGGFVVLPWGWLGLSLWAGVKPTVSIRYQGNARMAAGEGHGPVCARDGGEKCEDRPSLKVGVPCRPGPVAGFRTWQADPGSVDGDGCVG